MSRSVRRATGTRGVARVLDPGARTTIQDGGRPGHAHLGVPPSGAADRASFTLANRLVGNAEHAPTLETTLRGPTLQFDADATVAITGAAVDATLDGRPIAMRTPVRVRRGSRLAIGTATDGLRTYLAMRGGIDVPLVLGSASSDQLTGLGPAPLAQGDVIDLGLEALGAPTVDIAPPPRAASSLALDVVPGPREDWFAPDALTTLTSSAFRASAQVDRVGVRLAGPPLPHRGAEQLRSEGMVRGALQVPPSGEPILLLADHPTTGGYPVIAVVTEPCLDAAAQLRPGDEVWFRLTPQSAAAPQLDRLG